MISSDYTNREMLRVIFYYMRWLEKLCKRNENKKNKTKNDKIKVIKMWEDGKNFHQIEKSINRSHDFVKKTLVKNNLCQSCANTIESSIVKSND